MTMARLDEAVAEELESSAMFTKLFGHLEPHTFVSFDLLGVTWNISNHTLLMVLAGALLLLIFGLGYGRRFADGGAPRGPFSNALEALVKFVRDEMIYDNMGKEVGRRFAPLFLTQFFFIWMVNLLSNLPIPGIGGAPTASIAVTAALASTTLAMMLACGMKHSGVVGMWTSLVPKGLPIGLRELLFVVEVIGFFIKPFALTIRLFANMFGGHLVVLALFGLIYVSKSWVVLGGMMPLSLFVGILELFVAFLQAFIFTFLSIMFVQASIHPEH